MDKIILPNIHLEACHGVHEEEKCTPQPFSITVTLYLDLSKAAKSDDVADTVHYGILYDRIVNHVTTSQYNLIEALAGEIADLILADEKIEKCKVAVTKEQAKMANSTFTASVVIKKSRDD